MSDMMQFVDPKSLVVDEEALDKAAREHVTTFTYETPGPDSNGNRPYDYISLEEYSKAEGELDSIEKYSDLSEHHIVVLRHQARKLNLQKDVVDHDDRLSLIRCLFYHCENRDAWMARAKENK